MRETKLLVSCLFVFFLLLSLYPTVLAKPKDDRVPRSLEVPPAPEDYWNYEDVEGTIVANGPDFGLISRSLFPLAKLKYEFSLNCT